LIDSAKNALDTRELCAGYGQSGARRVVAGPLDLALPRGALVCLLGPNGAGKSTLIRTLTGTQPALSGHLLVDGQRLAAMTPRERARHIGVVLTDRVQAPMMTVRGLVELGRFPHTSWQGRLTDDDMAVVDHALTVTGANPLADRLVSELSDGERQRALVARALAQQPALLVLDEVTAFLDLPARIEIVRLLRHIAREEHRAVLLSTHDLDLALRSADRLWLLSGDGSLVDGMPEAMVMSGALARTFEGRGLRFDVARGAFLLDAQHGDVARVIGNGVAAVWTRHALERWGYTAVVHEDHEVVGPDDATVVTITVHGDHTWTVTRGGDEHRCEGWEALEQTVRHPA
jgi:iron complex transport system ATP-binding protein